MERRSITASSDETCPVLWQLLQQLLPLLRSGEACKAASAGTGHTGITRMLPEPVEGLADLRKVPLCHRFTVVVKVAGQHRLKRGR